MQKDTKHWPFKVAEKSDGRPAVEVEASGKTQQFSAEELSSMVLTKMRDTSESFLGRKSTMLSSQSRLISTMPSDKQLRTLVKLLA